MEANDQMSGKCMSPSEDQLMSPSSAKSLKQVRLPFKQLDQTIVSPVTSGKKRKLSNGESPASKVSKTVSNSTPKSTGKAKPVTVKNDENEVSSSSEAENLPLGDGRKAKPRLAGIEKLLEPPQQREVSTSGELIDLTAEEEKISEDKGVDISGITAQSDDDDVMEVETPTPKAAEATSTVTPNATPKSEKPTPKIGDLFSAAAKTPTATKRTSVELVTPAKVMKISEVKTPGSTGSPANVMSPNTSLDDSGLMEAPDSQKKNLGKKKVEKDIERQKKKEEKEKERLEKMKQKEAEKAEKERKKQEEKEKKEQEKQKKEKERLEKKEQLEREKQEKLKEKEEKKKKKIEALEEEKRKKEEDKKKKDEEKRQKEEERKAKEEEKKKEDEEKTKKAKKAKAVFENFFIKTETSPNAKPVQEESTGIFMAFEVKKDMTLAPSRRAHSYCEEFDSLFEDQDSSVLYVDEVKEGLREPVQTGKRKSCVLNGEDEVMIVRDEETPDGEEAWPQVLKTKYLRFAENNRPPYRGTWRKKSEVLTPRNPYKQDKDLFDYEVESDDDWEEEEPGESLSNSEGEGEGEDDDEKANNSDSDGDDDGFFVPHGYLSENEGGEEEEEESMNPEKMKALQIAKAKAFEMEMKRKCEYMKAIVIGCCWMNASYDVPEVYRCLREYQAVPLSETPIVITSKKGTSKSSNDDGSKAGRGAVKKPVPEEAMPDLIKFIHGNISGIKKLIRQFREFWHQKKNPKKESTADTSINNEADVPMDVSQSPGDRDVKPCEPESPAMTPESEHQISKRQLELKIMSIANYQKGSQHYRKCWYVKPETLKTYDLMDLTNKVVEKKDLNKSIEASPSAGPNPDLATTPKTVKAPPSVTITQFTVKADPNAAWEVKKPAPKPAPIVPSVVASPTPTSEAKPARRVQLTTLNSLFKPKLPKPINPQVSGIIDLTDDASNEGVPKPPSEDKPQTTAEPGQNSETKNDQVNQSSDKELKNVSKSTSSSEQENASTITSVSEKCAGTQPDKKSNKNNLAQSFFSSKNNNNNTQEKNDVEKKVSDVIVLE